MYLRPMLLFVMIKWEGEGYLWQAGPGSAVMRACSMQQL